jgi:transcriptional regulator with AAA-type ATPase domain
VVVLGEGVTLATPSALEILGPDDHVALRIGADELRRGAVPVPFIQLAEGRGYALRWDVIGEGVVVELRAQHGIEDLTRSDLVLFPALVVGERGTGRSTAARELVNGRPVVLDASRALTDPVAFASALRLRFDAPQPIILEDAHLMPIPLLAMALRQARRTSPAVVFTLASNEATDEAAAVLAAGTIHRVGLEPLRRRRHEIPELAAQMLATAPGGALRGLAPDAIRVLSRQAWPGNLSELRRVVELMAETPGTGSLRASDIPASHREAASMPTPRAEAERDIILNAVRSAEGNKRRAAELLGVSRSTLYNRMRALHISA